MEGWIKNWNAHKAAAYTTCNQLMATMLADDRTADPALVRIRRGRHFGGIIDVPAVAIYSGMPGQWPILGPVACYVCGGCFAKLKAAMAETARDGQKE